MRIGIDARLWNESGVGRYIRNLVQFLQILDKKNNYILFAQSKDVAQIQSQISHPKAGRPLAENLKNWKVVKVDIRWHTLEEQLKLPEVLNKENLDLMHFPYFSVPIFYNRPFVVTIHDLILHHFPTGVASTLPLPIYELKQIGYRFVIAQAAKKAAKIFAVSKTTRQEIIDHLGIDKEKIVVIYEGVDQQIANGKLQMAKTHKLSAISHKQYFLYVGNAYPHKNLDRLIEAFKILVKEYSDISLVLVGKEDYFYKRLKEKVTSVGFIEKVNFYGYATDEELSLLYKNSIALVIPSLMEGFGLPAIEAASNGCLVLASDIPAHREIMDDAVVFFNPNDVYDIAEKMKNVLDLRNLDRYSVMKKKGIKIAEKFSWRKMAAQTLTIYESCSTPCSE